MTSFAGSIVMSVDVGVGAGGVGGVGAGVGPGPGNGGGTAPPIASKYATRFGQLTPPGVTC